MNPKMTYTEAAEEIRARIIMPMFMHMRIAIIMLLFLPDAIPLLLLFVCRDYNLKRSGCQH